ncbi:MAG TPA: RNA polymerase sigma factor [Thermoleophilaceae bacterium]|nr:RNA polymerase sigma factor [Thermoleophilaceae bacterium]
MGEADPVPEGRRGGPSGDGLRGHGRGGRPPRGPGAGATVAHPREVVDRLFRRESGRAVATLIRVLGDFDLAEEAVQEAFVMALRRWPEQGVPDRPAAWITTVARRKAIDRLRRERRLTEKRADLAALARDEDEGDEVQPTTIPDDRLRLIFTCCHPALSPEARVALTLRTLGGLQTPQIARAFVTSEQAMQQRLVRAKRKIRDARIPYAVPADHDLPERLRSVLSALYLIFNEGYLASSGELVQGELCQEAIRLARVLVELMPDEPEARGLLALMLLQHSRRDARTGPDGELVLLPDQDRSLWNADEIAEGLSLTRQARREQPSGPYALQAAIAAEHARAAAAEDTDWEWIAALYDRLVAVRPSPVIELNRAVAVAMAEGPAAGLDFVERLMAEGSLERYHLLHSTRADLLARLGRQAEARSAYRAALELTANPVERSFLARRLDEISAARGS